MRWAIAGFAAGTAIVVWTFLRQHSTPATYQEPPELRWIRLAQR